MTALSAQRCRRCGSPMDLNIGADDESGAGDLDVVRTCLCGYQDRPPRMTRAEIRRRISEVNRSYRQQQELDGVIVPYRTDLPAVEEVE